MNFKVIKTAYIKLPWIHCTLSISNSFEFKNVVFLDKLTLSNAEYFERISLGISAAFSKSSAQNLAEKSFFSCTIKHIIYIYQLCTSSIPRDIADLL